LASFGSSRRIWSTSMSCPPEVLGRTQIRLESELGQDQVSAVELIGMRIPIRNADRRKDLEIGTLINTDLR
jgi:hypothetical protein